MGPEPQATSRRRWCLSKPCPLEVLLRHRDINERGDLLVVSQVIGDQVPYDHHPHRGGVRPFHAWAEINEPDAGDISTRRS